MLDVGVNIAFNYVTTGGLGVGAAMRESAVGVLNPAKTVQKVAKLGKALKACCCYVKGTPVYAENGPVAIDQLTLGERVYSRNPGNGEVELRPVTARYVTEGKAIYRLTTEDERGGWEAVSVTDNHPYWVTGQGWVESGDLEPGMALVNDAGGSVRVISLEAQGYAEDTYNIEVGEHHNYFVGEQRVLVHNCNCTNAAKGPIHARYGDGTPVYKDQRPGRLEPGPLKEAEGAHTKLRWDNANGRVYQGREFDANGNPVRDIDFTSPTFPSGNIRPDHAPAPHKHKWNVNDPSAGPKSGFKRQRGGDPL